MQSAAMNSLRFGSLVMHVFRSKVVGGIVAIELRLPLPFLRKVFQKMNLGPDFSPGGPGRSADDSLHLF
jgi:hypothetical protein